MAYRRNEITKITVDFDNGMYMELDNMAIEHVTMEQLSNGKGAIEMRLVFGLAAWMQRDDLPNPPNRLSNGKTRLLDAG